MPNYEYECTNCGNRFEVFQKMSDAPLTDCPKCRGSVQKIISGFGISFKGSGFYVNDAQGKSADKSKAASCSGKSCSSCSGCKS